MTDAPIVWIAEDEGQYVISAKGLIEEQRFRDAATKRYTDERGIPIKGDVVWGAYRWIPYEDWWQDRSSGGWCSRGGTYLAEASVHESGVGQFFATLWRPYAWWNRRVTPTEFAKGNRRETDYYR